MKITYTHGFNPEPNPFKRPYDAANQESIFTTCMLVMSMATGSKKDLDKIRRIVINDEFIFITGEFGTLRFHRSRKEPEWIGNYNDRTLSIDPISDLFLVGLLNVLSLVPHGLYVVEMEDSDNG